jgi:phosphoribosylaminoimidazolecarboxamide formyltransferase/IMP cyclohydrolase
MKRALVSVYDKTGVVDFVKGLVAAGYEVVSSGGTAAALREAGIEVVDVETVTASPEILGGRVKTLHPRIHGGILARGEGDDAELEANEIERIELVVANLYPFAETVASAATETEIVEKIDIGGPAMVRAAAKNHSHVGVVTSPDQYDEVAAAVESGGLTDEFRRRLAAEAFFLTASYDAAIVGWIGDDMVIPLRHAGSLRYGENPHQEAMLYRQAGQSSWWADARQVQGKEMSFNNYADAEAAWRLVTALGEGSVAVIKHTNAAGAARGTSIARTFEAAWSGDSLAAFGGVVAINGTIDAATAEAISKRFVEVVIARDMDDEAFAGLAGRTSLRVLLAPLPSGTGLDLRRVEGGLLAQEYDSVDLTGWDVVSERQPSEEQLTALRFAWVVAAHTKSNAIVIADGETTVGVGAGDQSRVGAAERAVAKAGDRARGGVAASDAFFPFRDGLDTLVRAGVTAVVEPGGSRNDQELIDSADEQGAILVFTNRRHFKH